MAEKKARIEYVDLFRAFGIILMVMGHIQFGGLFSKWIHAFHMPLFFFVSGWFFKSRPEVPVGKQLLKKARSLLVPYLCFEVIVCLICLLFIPDYRSPDTLKYMFFENTYAIPVHYGVDWVSPIPGAMWFLTALFICEAVYILLDRLFGKSWKLHVAAGVLAVFGMLAPRFLPFRLPWATDAAFVGLGLFHIGRTVRDSRLEWIFNLKWWQSLLIGGGVSVLIMLNRVINMRLGNYDYYPLFWINALGAIVAGWNLSRDLEHVLGLHPLAGYVSKWLKGIGKNSIVYLCLNQIVIILAVKLCGFAGLHGVIAKGVCLILTMAILFGFEKLICNTKLKVLIGK